MEFVKYFFVRYSSTSIKGTTEQFIEHQHHLQKIDQEGKLMLVAPLGDGSGGILFIKAETIESAREIISEDLYVQLGVMDVEIHPVMIPKVRDLEILHRNPFDYDWVIDQAHAARIAAEDKKEMIVN